jgi:ribosomal protein L17
MERSGATLGPTLRQVFSDEDLGTTTASEERHRDVPGGSYTMGVVVLYQETTAMKIINDTDTGTAQRFLWFAGHSPSAPPSGLVQAPRMVSPSVTTLPREQRIDGSENYVLTVDPAITEKLRIEDAQKRDAYSLGDANRDSQKPAVVAKVAALACLIEGRTLITMDDWDLAEEIYASSRAVQDELIELAEEQDRAKRREVAAKAGEADHVRKSFRAEVKRVAESIVRKAQKLGRPVTRREITQTITSKKRAYIPEALDMAVHETGWLTEKDDKFAVGPVPLDNGS